MTRNEPTHIDTQCPCSGEDSAQRMELFEALVREVREYFSECIVVECCKRHETPSCYDDCLRGKVSVILTALEKTVSPNATSLENWLTRVRKVLELCSSVLWKAAMRASQKGWEDLKRDCESTMAEIRAVLGDNTHE